MGREASNLFFSYSQPLVAIVVGILYKRWGRLPISSREALIHVDQGVEPSWLRRGFRTNTTQQLLLLAYLEVSCVVSPAHLVFDGFAARFQRLCFLCPFEDT